MSFIAVAGVDIAKLFNNMLCISFAKFVLFSLLLNIYCNLGNRVVNLQTEYFLHRQGFVFDVYATKTNSKNDSSIFIDSRSCSSVNKWLWLFLPMSNCFLPEELWWVHSEAWNSMEFYGVRCKNPIFPSICSHILVQIDYRRKCDVLTNTQILHC